MEKNSDHPEVIDIINICKVSPKTKATQDICDKLNREQIMASHSKKSRKKK